MMKLLANSDFRKLTMDLQELMTNKGLDVKVRSRHRAVRYAGRSEADPSSPFRISDLGPLSLSLQEVSKLGALFGGGGGN